MEMALFMRNVIPEPNSGCWLWIGPAFKERRRGKAYGRFGKHNKLAHRVSWSLHHGDPGAQMVCHRCDNVACVNPDHLFLGNAQSNSDDKVAKGRQTRGCAVRQAKLTIEQVRIIKGSHDSEIELATRFGVTPGAIYNIRSGLCWKWVTP